MNYLLARYAAYRSRPILKLPIAYFASKGSVNEPLQIQKDLIHQKPEDIKQRMKLQGYITVTGPSNISAVSGIPEEHIQTRMVRIFEPVKNAMQSGTDNVGHWEMEFETRERWENPLMGWSSSGDPLSNMNLSFTTKEEAMEHCIKNGWKYFVDSTTQKPPRAKSYALNFSWNKRTRTSTK